MDLGGGGFSAEQVDEDVVQLSANLVAVVGVGDVTDGNLGAANHRLDVDRGCGGEIAHVA